MEFLHPILFAAGAAAVAIPIVIHFLLRRKRKPVKWAAMRFLLEAHKKRRRRRRLEQILLLAARCLLILLLAAAIARPIAGGRGLDDPATLVLVIDNSLGSSIIDDNGKPALERFKRTATERLDRLSSARGDRVAVITAAAPAAGLVSPATLDLDAARRLVDSIEPTDSAMSLSAALALASGALPESAGQARVVLIGDWRRGAGLEDAGTTSSPARFAADLLDLAVTRPADDEPPNLRITSFVPGRGAVFPGDTSSAEQAIVTIEREGDTLPEEAATVLVESIGPAGPSPRREAQAVTLPRGERVVTVPVLLPLPSDGNADIALEASVHGEPLLDRIARDSVAWRTVRLREAARVGVVHTRRANRALNKYDAADWVRVALRPDALTPVEIREVNAAGMTAPDLAGLDAAVLTRPDLLTDDAWAALARFVDGGSTLIVFPPADQSVHRWPDGLAKALGLETTFAREPMTLDPPEPLVPGGLADAFPMLSGDLGALAGNVGVATMLEIDCPDARVALRTERGGAFLCEPASRLWVFASALDPAWTDLPAKPLLLPLIQEMVRQSVAPSTPTTVTAGTGLAPPRGAIELVNIQTERRLAMSEATGRIPASDQAGVWTSRNARGEPLGLVAVTPDHRAGRTGPTPADEVLGVLRQAVPGVEPRWLDAGDEVAREQVAAAEEGSEWIPFLIAAALALIELVAARVASHAGGGAGAPKGAPA
ncbi:MAG: BatA domain-containing protein [Phycisphaeraceae bacterium]|nr:MAG: BatA domain-containing protein [Phycisphaeraceae bacterium]